MKKYTISFSSVTIAIKAQSVLSKSGISTEVIRTPKNLSSGCGYSLVGYGSVSEAANVLDEFGIKYRALTEGQ